MSTDKRRIGTVVVYVFTIVLALFLMGQIALVTLYGPKGVILDLGVNGYPDYIALSQVVSNDVPTINQDFAPTTANKDKLIDSVRQSSLVVYTDTDDMLLDFVMGDMEYKSVSTIYGSVSLDGGMLASMYQYIGEHMLEIESVLDYRLDTRFALESVVVSRGIDGVHMQYIVSIDKVELVNMLDIIDSYKDSLSSMLKSNRLYFTLECEGTIDGGKIVAVEDFRASISDASISKSKVLVDYIDDRTDGMLKSVVLGYMTALNGLGRLSVGYDRLVVKN